MCTSFHHHLMMQFYHLKVIKFVTDLERRLGVKKKSCTCLDKNYWEKQHRKKSSYCVIPTKKKFQWQANQICMQKNPLDKFPTKNNMSQPKKVQLWLLACKILHVYPL
jgi:hypothetical protein